MLEEEAGPTTGPARVAVARPVVGSVQAGYQADANTDNEQRRRGVQLVHARGSVLEEGAAKAPATSSGSPVQSVAGSCCSGVGNCEAETACGSRNAPASALERVHAWRAFSSGEQQRPCNSTARWKMCFLCGQDHGCVLDSCCYEAGGSWYGLVEAGRRDSGIGNVPLKLLSIA